MKIQQTTSDNGKAAIIRCDAPIDKESSAELKQFADSLISRNIQYVMLDAAMSDFIAAEGLTVIAALHRKLRSLQGLLVISGINHEIKSLFELLGFSPELIIAASENDAREMIERAGGGIFKNKPVDASESSFQPASEKEACRKEPGIPGSADIPEGETLFSQPLIVECEECSSFVRVHSSGTFLCPSCHAEFNVERDGTVIF